MPLKFLGPIDIVLVWAPIATLADLQGEAVTEEERLTALAKRIEAGDTSSEALDDMARLLGQIE